MDGSEQIAAQPQTASGAVTASEEAQLLARYARGDRVAAAQLTKHLAPRLFQMAYRVLGDRAEAEDVTQEALLRLWRIAPDWRSGEARVSTWTYRVALNLCRDRLRRSKGRGVALDAIPEPEDGAKPASDVIMTRERASALDAALADLPDRQRQAVILRHLEELTNPEIAEIMEISVEAVESLVARGKRSLAAGLKLKRAELGYQDDG